MPVWGYIGGGALLMGLLGGWTVRDWKADADLLKAQEKTDEVRKEEEAKWAGQAQFFEDQIVALSARSSTNTREIREIYRNVEVPAECAAPADVSSVLVDAVRAANAAAAGERVAAVPPAGGATHTPD